MKNWASGISHTGRLHTHICFLFCFHFREDFARKDSGGRREEVKGCRSTHCQWQSWLSANLSAFFNGLSLLLSSLSAGEQDSVNSALDSSSSSDTICHLIHFQGRGLAFVCMCAHMPSPPCHTSFQQTRTDQLTSNISFPGIGLFYYLFSSSCFRFPCFNLTHWWEALLFSS